MRRFQLVNRASDTSAVTVFCFVAIIFLLRQRLLRPTILHGDSASIMSYPFFVGTEYCGAAVLSELWLLTAAHCVDSPALIRRKVVYAGGERKDNSKVFKYDEIKIHPMYGSLPRVQLSYDIALLRMEAPLTFTDTIRPISLPHPGEIISGRPEHTFIGRGVDESGKISPSLMKMKVIKLSIEECMNETGPTKAYHRLLLDNSLICARKVDKKPGMCMGDSGSPLIHQAFVVGLASFLPIAKKDCTLTNIGFYTNVVYFVPWIKSVTGLT